MKIKLVAALMAFITATSFFTGCAGSGFSEEKMIRTGETISQDSKWINSCIDGAIDENTTIKLEDDFYSYVNRDWILNTQVEDSEDSKLLKIGKTREILDERINMILSGKSDEAANGNVEIDKNIIEHDEELVERYATAAGNWDKRNEAGVEPVRKYIEAIDAIDSIDELSDYILNNNNMNITGAELIPVFVDKGLTDSTNYYVYVDTGITNTYSDSTIYTGGAGYDAYKAQEYIDDMNDNISYVTSKLGYSDAQTKKLLKDCYEFEANSLDHQGDKDYYSKEWTKSEKSIEKTPIEDIEKLQGNYPLTEVIEKYGYETDGYVVVNPAYIKYIASIYDESHLESIKSYLKVRTIKEALPYLDREAFEKISGECDKAEDEKTEDAEILKGQVMANLSGCLNTVYISRYSRTEEREELTKLVEDIREFYKGMLADEDWLDEETKNAAIEKLEAMKANVLFPDEFIDYSFIDYGSHTDILDIVGDIKMQKRGFDSRYIGKEVDRNEWNLDDKFQSTIQVNAFYSSTSNSIIISSGICLGDLYSYGMSEEDKLASIGMIVGHEITHGFDPNGAKYDKNGNENNWFSFKSRVAFQNKALKLTNYYNAITPYPGADNVNGKNVSGEATADMGGMKCALGLAKDIEGFDYDKFFRSYENTWAEKDGFDRIEVLALDEHPLNMLRGNVVVMQFDEFYDTYDIKPGDGMYLAPEERICIW